MYIFEVLISPDEFYYVSQKTYSGKDKKENLAHIDNGLRLSGDFARKFRLGADSVQGYPLLIVTRNRVLFVSTGYDNPDSFKRGQKRQK